MKRVMVIDALNMFIRNYIVNPMISSNGNPIGGAVGFLNSVKKLMREAKPDQVIICWDGAGGSQKRRQTVKEYKQGRKPLRKNYKVEGMSVQSEKENMVWQQRILMEMLNEMPIIQLMLDRVEADDIISMVASNNDTRVGKRSLCLLTRTSCNCWTKRQFFTGQSRRKPGPRRR